MACQQTKLLKFARLVMLCFYMVLKFVTLFLMLFQVLPNLRNKLRIKSTIETSKETNGNNICNFMNLLLLQQPRKK